MSERKKQLLILTCEDDLHVDPVIKRLNESNDGLGVIRINSDNFSVNLDYCFHWNNSGELETQKLKLVDNNLSAQEVSVIWYRKPDKPAPHPELKDKPAMECSVQEYQELMRSFYGFFPAAKWVNDYWQMQKYSVKANQMWIAKEVGLTVPETIITSDVSEVKKLSRKYPEIIVKPLTFSGFLWENSQYGCFTNVLSPEDVKKLTDKDLAFAPAIFQQRIHKSQELRITIIGEQVFACEIQTKPGTIEHIDWRIDSVEELPHKIVDLPGEIADKLKKMLNQMGLNFGAFDLIVNEEGIYYFIEINPNGQYFWIELLTGAPLTEAMVSLVLRLASDSYK